MTTTTSEATTEPPVARPTVRPAKVAFASFIGTGTSVAYQVGGMVTSGPAPFIAAAIMATGAGLWAISTYIVIACAVTFLALIIVPFISGSRRGR
ncbi:hypothetical protein [Nocardia grenadensis]